MSGRSVARSCSVGRWRRECRRWSGSAVSRCCGTTCCAAGHAGRPSGSCAPAPRWPRVTSRVGRASGTATSTTWCPPTTSSTVTAGATRSCSKGCTTRTPTSPGLPTTSPSRSTTRCRSTPTSRRPMLVGWTCISTTTMCSSCSSAGPSDGGSGHRWRVRPIRSRVRIRSPRHGSRSSVIRCSTSRCAPATACTCHGAIRTRQRRWINTRTT